MKYFKDDVVDFEEHNGEKRDRFNEACKLNQIEYLEAKKRLPKKFIEIYEKTVHFDDDIIPNISIITETGSFTYDEKKGSPSIMRMIIVDYDDYSLGWEILIYNIKEMSLKWVSDNTDARIDCISYDELLVADKKHISWEIAFSGGLIIKIVFKELNIRELGDDEIEGYRQPLKSKK